MSKEKLGKAGRFYSLTPKAYEFIDAFEEFCSKHEIKKEEIYKFLVYLIKPEPENMSFAGARQDLVKRGYLSEFAIKGEEDDSTRDHE